ncbi:MAG TPA: hypothetical protein VFS29_01515 [Motilibacteraceae bacterium]|nr:hypothetical protein [Motilibacteraceae bacterium]
MSSQPDAGHIADMESVTGSRPDDLVPRRDQDRARDDVLGQDRGGRARHADVPVDLEADVRTDGLPDVSDVAEDGQRIGAPVKRTTARGEERSGDPALAAAGTPHHPDAEEAEHSLAERGPLTREAQRRTGAVDEGPGSR